MRKIALLVALLLGAFVDDASAAYDCENHPVSVADADWCKYFDEFPYTRQDDLGRKVNWLVKESMAAIDLPDKAIRSYAFVVSVWDYRKGQVDEDEVEGIKADKPAILKFISGQGFDEAIVLNNGDATADRIRKIFTEYYIPKFESAAAAGQKIRFMFIFDGHGWQPRTSGGTGALALAEITDDRDLDYDHRFSLAELRGLLQDVSQYTQASIALLGSCYSGSVFEDGAGHEEDFAPGSAAWIAAAAPRGIEAWELKDRSGTVFFTNLFRAVETWHGASADLVPQDPGGNIALDMTQYAPTLRDVTTLINTRNFFGGKNPETGQPYPPFMVDTIEFSGGKRAAYRFVAGQDLADKVGQNIGLNLDKVAFTGSSIEGRSDITVVHTPATYSIRGIDLSPGNIKDSFDFEKIKSEAGISFVYFKASEGQKPSNPEDQSKEDQKFGLVKRAWDKARAAGLSVGTYHTFRFCEEAQDQFAYIKERVPRTEGMLPIAIDVEWYNGAPNPLVGNCGSTASKAHAKIYELARDLEDYYGKKPLIYLVSSSVKEIVGDSADYPLWIANYSANAAAIGPGEPWTLWQYTGRGRIPGSQNAVDFNYFFGNEAQFALFRKSGTNIAGEVASK
ncbi:MULTISPECIES: glycoside hydrolase family 25 protein [Mesorhizobium]|uniref:Uncharacterized protein n=5 Tax=Mesorhizobium TaxID=68287 RepID=Q8KGI8_RHILI|nr:MULTISPECIES: glycoside hydrolase family 25 protein [Mesorhizobium]MBZ9907550.1 glycoside hydrolase family 25 protein [Mesorhizobium sp. BR115XR7A]QGX80784.1 hypothetical protein EB234_31360 [Mesorhizobium japonicum R7A]QJF04930.1 hypothetical protein R7A2020_30945 [Mesorhizobium japonicum R7A]QJF10998.1 hypothetical protein HID05_30935 [Mesorhizobium japonicum]QJI86872.1 glycoside hydrolase family 25 protein [Mesorhizobium japonicum]